mgnify:CR=1 FL=1
MKKKKSGDINKKLKNTWTTKSKRLLAGLFFVFSFLLYANTLQHEYTLDDFSIIKENYVTQQGLKGIPTAWKEHYRFGYWNSNASLYRPFTLTTFNIDWAIAPDNPAYAHFINVLLYGLSGMILFLALCNVMRGYNPWIPVLITGLFMAHPLHVECVANIKGRDEILGFLFLFLSVYSYWRYLDLRKIIWLLVTVCSFSLALFSKESTITFISILPLMVYTFRSTKLKDLSPLALLLIPTVIFLVVRHQVIGSMGVGDTSVLDNALIAAPNKLSFFASAIAILGEYLYKMILPLGLVHEKGYSAFIPIAVGSWKFMVSFILFLGLGIYGVTKIRDRNELAFGILFFLLSISILCNIFILIGVHYAERLLYYPLLGFCIAAIFGIFQVSKVPLRSAGNLKNDFKKSKIPVVIIGTVIISFSFLTILRNPAWKNSYTLYQTDIRKAPKSAKLNYHLGLEFVKKGLDNNSAQGKSFFVKAKQQFEKAIALYPKYADAHGQLGLSYYRDKQKNLAMKSYEKSLALNKNNAKVLSNMGILYFEAQQLDKAEEVYRKSVKLDPRFVDARRNLGSVMAMKGNFAEAANQFSKALKYEPNNAVLHFYLGQATRDGGNAGAAKPHFDRAYQLDPSLKK